MRLGVLFSGGKDSTLALQKAAEKEETVCLITLVSENKESLMFHVPNINVTTLQSDALDLPLIQRATTGKPKSELEDLERAIAQAVKEFKIQGVVSGAIESVFQSERIQRICNRLDLWCFNPLWKRNQKELLEEVVAKGYRVIISGVFAYPLDRTWLGKELNNTLIRKLLHLQNKYGLSPSGEGGEIETTVLDAPIFKERIEVLDYQIEAKGNTGIFNIKQARLTKK